MFICLCKPTTDKDIEIAIKNGANNLSKVKKITGACQDCCGCKASIKEIFIKLKKLDN